MSLYLCINKTDEPLKNKDMNTDNTLSFISSMISSEASYRTLVDMIDEIRTFIKDINEDKHEETHEDWQEILRLETIAIDEPAVFQNIAICIQNDTIEHNRNKVIV